MMSLTVGIVIALGFGVLDKSSQDLNRVISHHADDDGCLSHTIKFDVFVRVMCVHFRQEHHVRGIV